MESNASRLPTPPLLDGQGEVKLITLRLGKSPAGLGRLTLHLLADQLAGWEVVGFISHETVRQTLKKWYDEVQD